MFPPPPSLPFKMKPNIGSLQNSTSLYWSPQLHILLYLRLIWQRTLESSECAQSTVLESKGQSTSLSSVPVHRTSSKTIGPLPCPKKANERAVASVHQRREEMLTRVVLFQLLTKLHNISMYTYCIWRSPAVCTPLWHQGHSRGHHIQCPRHCSCTLPHDPHWYCSLQPT